MDKNNTRKIRIDTAQQTAENTAMDEETYEELLESATYMAYRRFRAPTDDHVLGVFERLAWNLQRGLGEAGAVTVH